MKFVPDGFVAFCISVDVSRAFSDCFPESRFCVRTAREPNMEEMSKLVVAAPEFDG